MATQQTQRIKFLNTATHNSSWFDAYRRFLFNSGEPLMLKMAPLALLGYLPIDIIDEFIPFVGILDDIPYVILWGYVLLTTLRKVQKYR